MDYAFERHTIRCVLNSGILFILFVCRILAWNKVSNLVSIRDCLASIGVTLSNRRPVDD